ncbi:hypothetical protein CRG98_048897, partial [Punica granatum]
GERRRFGGRAVSEADSSCGFGDRAGGFFFGRGRAAGLGREVELWVSAKSRAGILERVRELRGFESGS